MPVQRNPRDGRTLFVVFLVCILVMIGLFAGLEALGAFEYSSPPEPSTWDGASVALSVPTPEPNPFPLSTDDFVTIFREIYWEGYRVGGDCSYEGEHPISCEFRWWSLDGQQAGLTGTIYGNANGDIESIKFTFDRYRMAEATELFNRLVWNTGLEKPAEAARELVDKELGRIGLRYAVEYVDRIQVQAHIGYNDADNLVIKFSK